KSTITKLSVITLLVLTLALIPLSSVSAATPIYVQPGGDDTNCDGTADVAYPGSGGPGLACAVATIQKGIDLVDAGGTVYVAAGTYTENITFITTNKTFNLSGEVDLDGLPLPVLQGSLSIDHSGADDNWFVENMNFQVNSSTTLLLKNINGYTIRNCRFDGNDGWLANPFNGVNLISGPNGNTNVTVEDSLFTNGLYVGVNGYVNYLTVTDSIFEDVKSGINLQGGGGNLLVENSEFSVVAQGATNDTYGIRFASSSGAADNMIVSGSIFNVDPNGFTPDPGTYHSAIVIRAAATGDLMVGDSFINGEVVNLTAATPLNATCNWWSDLSGPTNIGNPGGEGQPISAGTVNFAPWLVYDTDGNTATG
ncbi:MAG: hypothetical protein JW704_10250, partial [Anaerolineaceae bacterium]|nr:hypothetical protein [Anaerolineaceae bacterium]